MDGTATPNPSADAIDESRFGEIYDVRESQVIASLGWRLRTDIIFSPSVLRIILGCFGSVHPLECVCKPWWCNWRCGWCQRTVLPQWTLDRHNQRCGQSCPCCRALQGEGFGACAICSDTRITVAQSRALHRPLETLLPVRYLAGCMRDGWACVDYVRSIRDDPPDDFVMCGG